MSHNFGSLNLKSQKFLYQLLFPLLYTVLQCIVHRFKSLRLNSFPEFEVHSKLVGQWRYSYLKLLLIIVLVSIYLAYEFAKLWYTWTVISFIYHLRTFSLYYIFPHGSVEWILNTWKHGKWGRFCVFHSLKVI